MTPVEQPAHNPQRDELICALYAELRRRASGKLRGQRRDLSFGPTDLVNLAIYKLWNREDSVWGNEELFLRQASVAMRSLLVDHARSRTSQKRQHCKEFLAADEIFKSYQKNAIDIVALDEALEELKKLKPVVAEAVVLRFFGGLKFNEIAKILDISERSLRDQWDAAMDWLKRKLK